MPKLRGTATVCLRGQPRMGNMAAPSSVGRILDDHALHRLRVLSVGDDIMRGGAAASPHALHRP
jgi:aspartate-semialdehyde dehydrogenase